MANRQPNIRNLALRQRRLIWLLLFAILLQFVPYVTAVLRSNVAFEAIAIACGVAQLVLYALMAVGVVRVLIAQGNNVIMIVICGILMLALCANLLLLIMVNMSATRTLRRAGVRVGFMGVDSEELERVLNADLCKACGYNLTGNVSGICPECGLPIPPDQYGLITAVAQDGVSSV